MAPVFGDEVAGMGAGPDPIDSDARRYAIPT